jgi:DNA-directed RNA polymerase subunit omega
MIDTLPLIHDSSSGKFDSRYRVVLVAAQRAKQIMRSGKSSQTSKYAKETSVALEEVLRGDVKYLIGQDARQAIRDSKRQTERGFDQAVLAEGDEDAKEIQQQLSVYIDDSPKVAEPEEAAESVEVADPVE